MCLCPAMGDKNNQAYIEICNGIATPLMKLNERCFGRHSYSYCIIRSSNGRTFIADEFSNNNSNHHQSMLNPSTRTFYDGFEAIWYRLIVMAFLHKCSENLHLIIKLMAAGVTGLANQSVNGTKCSSSSYFRCINSWA